MEEKERQERQLKDLLAYRLWQHATKDVSKALEFAHESLKLNEAVGGLRWVADYLQEVVGEIERIQKSENLLQVFSAPVAVVAPAQKVEIEMLELLSTVLKGREEASARVGNGKLAATTDASGTIKEKDKKPDNVPSLTDEGDSISTSNVGPKASVVLLPMVRPLSEYYKQAFTAVLGLGGDKIPLSAKDLVRRVWPQEIKDYSGSVAAIENRLVTRVRQAIGVCNGRIFKILDGASFPESDKDFYEKLFAHYPRLTVAKLKKMTASFMPGTPQPPTAPSPPKNSENPEVEESEKGEIVVASGEPNADGAALSVDGVGATAVPTTLIPDSKNGDDHDGVLKAVNDPIWLRPLRAALLGADPTLNMQELMRRTKIQDRREAEVIFRTALGRFQKVIDGREDNNDCGDFTRDFIMRWPGLSLDEVVRFLVEQRDGAPCFIGTGGENGG